LHERDHAAANAFRGVFGRVGKAQRLLGAKTDAGDEAKGHQPCEAGVEPDARHRRKGRDNGCKAEQQQVELVDGFAAEPIGEFALAERSDKQTEQGNAADPRDLLLGDEPAADQIRHQRAEDREIENVEEISRGDQGQDAPVQRP
jgi:hypothetical protein